MGTFGERLVEENYARVQAYVRMRVSAAEAEDLIGDIFLRAIERQGQLRGEAAPWLLGIARNRIADYYRGKGTGLRVEAEQRDMRPGSAADVSPLERLEHEEFRARLRDRMSVLTELERDVIAFKFTEGLSNVQIARVLGITPGTLGVILHRALGRLRSAMLKER